MQNFERKKKVHELCVCIYYSILALQKMPTEFVVLSFHVHRSVIVEIRFHVIAVFDEDLFVFSPLGTTILKPYLNSCFGQFNAQCELLTEEYVRIVRTRECPLQFLQLHRVECGPFSGENMKMKTQEKKKTNVWF